MLIAVSVVKMLVCVAGTHRSAVLLCRLGGSKRADHAVLRDVAGDEAQTWSALLMQRGLHSRTALLCGDDLPRLAAVSVRQPFSPLIRRTGVRFS